MQTLPEAGRRAFDELARDYDDRFTSSFLGRLLRRAVWRRLDALVPRDAHVLDLGCGTGADAVHLARRGCRVVAIDAAPEMVDAARRKAAEAGVADRIDVRHGTIESLGAMRFGERAFDAALSNFGALNCSSGDAEVARNLAAVLGPGATVLLVVMGPLVPWEWAWFLGKGDARTAFRRLRSGGTPWRGMTVRYPSIRALRRAFAPWFHVRGVRALGCLVPPSYAESWAVRHQRLVLALDRWERRFESVWPLPSLADHYVLELERR